MSEPQWLMRVEGGLAAHFKQPDGSSRPGTDWVIGLKRGESAYKVMVRAYVSDGASARTRSDTEYQARTVMGYLSDLLSQGWSPEQPGNLTIVIQDPS